jgi:hypothetical protein
MLAKAVSGLYEAKQKNGGRLPHLKMAEVLQGLLDNGANANRDMLNQRLKRYKKPPAGISPEAPLSVIDVTIAHQSNVSSLLGVEGVENNMVTNTNTKMAGRPKGSTRDSIKKANDNIEECKVEISLAYQKKMNESKAAGRERVTPGYLTNLIRDTKTAKGIPKDYYISEKTIKARIIRKKLHPPHPGTSSPLEGAEEAVVQILIQMGNIRQPLTATEGLQLMNGLIKNQDLQRKLIDFKLKRRMKGDLEHLGRVGKSYWNGFMKRHHHQLVTKRGEKFASNRADWSKHSYIKQMYDVIYDEFVGAGVARKLPQEVFMDRLGNIVEKEKKFGEAIDIEITHPDYILFGDETGCNTSQKKDGHIAGTKYVVGRGQVPKTQCATTDHRFTLLPITHNLSQWQARHLCSHLPGQVV